MALGAASATFRRSESSAVISHARGGGSGKQQFCPAKTGRPAAAQQTPLGDSRQHGRRTISICMILNQHEAMLALGMGQATMRKATAILLVIATLSLGATSQAFANDRDFMGTLKAVQRLRDQQHAKCEMDADQYIDEHSIATSGLSEDQIKSLTSIRWVDRYELCMEAAGYPMRNSSLREKTADTYRRMRELWVKSGKSQSDLGWFDKYVDHLLSSMEDLAIGEATSDNWQIEGVADV
jgi:hypothetical protein